MCLMRHLVQHVWAFALICSLVLTNAFSQAQSNRSNWDLDLILEQIEYQYQDFAMGCLPLNNPEQLVIHNPTTRFPLASVAKLLIFIEYVERVVEGKIPFSETVSLETLNRYALPRTDRGSHDRFLASYSTPPDIISLWEIATVGMMTYSSNPASDYLLTRLGNTDWDDLYIRLGITATDHPHPLTSIPFLMNNHENGIVTSSMVASMTMAQANDYLYRYINDETWRTDETNYRLSIRRLFPIWEVQSELLQNNTANGTVEDFLRIMQAIYAEDSPLERDVRELVRRGLRTTGVGYIDNLYQEHGSKLGFYSGGTLTLVSYGHPIDGEPIITVLFLRNVSNNIYREMLRQNSIEALAHTLHFNQCQISLRYTSD